MTIMDGDMTRMIEGEIEDPREEEIRALRDALSDTQAALASARVEITSARREAARATDALRRQLNPLYRALQAVFGELDALTDQDDSPAAPSASSSVPSSREAAVWESWKQKLGVGTSASRVIDALLAHGELNVPQLKVAAKMANQTVYDSVHRLNKLGLISKNGGRFSLKKLS